MTTTTIRPDGSTPRTGSTCPASSHRAEARNRSGLSGRQVAAVRRLVYALPYRTASQLADYASPAHGAFATERGERRLQIRRRLTDLKNAGHVRQLRIPGAREVEWVLTYTGREAVIAQR